MNMEEIKNDEAGKESAEKLDSKVIPVMREAVAAVQLILFGQLKEKLAGKYSSWPPQEFKRLIGCIVNDLFGTPAQDKESQEFARQHIEVIEEELRAMAENLPEMVASLTDTLRMQTLCDHEEGVNSLPTLLRAREFGLLEVDRSVPLPSTFMIAVRNLGATHGLLEPIQYQDPASE